MNKNNDNKAAEAASQTHEALLKKDRKLLLYLAVIVISLLLLFTLARSSSGKDMPTYSYNSMILKLVKGQVRIKAADGHIAYEGEVDRGFAEGQGSLYNAEGVLVYQGNFKKSRYEEEGKQFFANGALEYEGSFHQNLFEGSGKLYRENESLSYEGGFSGGQQNGTGTLYDEGGTAIYSGTFRDGDVLYSDLLSKNTSELLKSYTGESLVYENSDTYVTVLSGIDAISSGPRSSDTLDGLPENDTVYVLKNRFAYGSDTCKTMGDIQKILGEPSFEGTTTASFSDAVAIHELEKKRDILSGDISMTEKASAFSDVKEIGSYDESYSLSIASFQHNGLSYTFVLDPESGSGEERKFVFYSIQKQGSGQVSGPDATQNGSPDSLEDQDAQTASSVLSLSSAVELAEKNSKKIASIDARISTAKAKEDSAKKAESMAEQKSSFSSSETSYAKTSFESDYKVQVAPMKQRAAINTLKQKKKNTKKNLKSDLFSGYARIAALEELVEESASNYRNFVSAVYRSNERIRSGLSPQEELPILEGYEKEEETALLKNQKLLKKEKQKLSRLIGEAGEESSFSFGSGELSDFDVEEAASSLSDEKVSSLKEKALASSTAIVKAENEKKLAEYSLDTCFSLLKSTYGEGNAAILEPFYNEAKSGITVSPTAFRDAYETFIDSVGGETYGFYAETAFTMLEEGNPGRLSDLQKDPYKLYVLSKQLEEASAALDSAKQALSDKIDAAASAFFLETGSYGSARTDLESAKKKVSDEQKRFDAGKASYGDLQKAIAEASSASSRFFEKELSCIKKLSALDKLVLGGALS